MPVSLLRTCVSGVADLARFCCVMVIVDLSALSALVRRSACREGRQVDSNPMVP